MIVKTEWDDGVLYNGDCLKVMGTLKKGSVDLVLTDLPYGTTNMPWDSVLPMDELWEHWWFLLKDTGIVVLTGSQPFTTTLIQSQIERFRYEWIWSKRPTGHGNIAHRPMKAHENVLVFSKYGLAKGAHRYAVEDRKGDPSKRVTYNPQNLQRIEEGKHYDARKESDVNFKGSKKARAYISYYTNWPQSVLEFKNDKQRHETQKPADLFEYLIKTYTDEGETVLDCCSGSGTTAVAARRSYRRFICIEKDKRHYDLTIVRLKNEAKNFFRPKGEVKK